MNSATSKCNESKRTTHGSLTCAHNLNIKKIAERFKKNVEVYNVTAV